MQHGGRPRPDIRGGFKTLAPVLARRLRGSPSVAQTDEGPPTDSEHRRQATPRTSRHPAPAAAAVLPVRRDARGAGAEAPPLWPRATDVGRPRPGRARGASLSRGMLDRAVARRSEEVTRRWACSTASARSSSGSPTTTPSPGASPRRSIGGRDGRASAPPRCSSRSASGRSRRASARTSWSPATSRGRRHRACLRAWKERYGTLDILVHAVAFAKREELDGRVRGHLPRGLRARPRHLGLLAGGAGARRPPADARRRQHPHADLLRRREGGRQLQRDGRRQGRPGGLRALPGRGPRPVGHPGQRHQRGPGADARRLGRQRLQDAAPAVPGHRADAPRPSPSRTSATPRCTSAATCRATSPARSSTSTAATTSSGCPRSSTDVEPGGGRRNRGEVGETGGGRRKRKARWRGREEGSDLATGRRGRVTCPTTLVRERGPHEGPCSGAVSQWSDLRWTFAEPGRL